MRGDPPNAFTADTTVQPSTPHARGSTPAVVLAIVGIKVYPACAGIHPSGSLSPDPKPCLPRMRGDPPCAHHYLNQTPQSTPHARGSTIISPRTPSFLRVYPACAGIHPTATLGQEKGRCLPRMRGDPPVGYLDFLRRSLSTPHARGSTCPGSCP